MSRLNDFAEQWDKTIRERFKVGWYHDHPVFPKYIVFTDKDGEAAAREMWEYRKSLLAELGLTSMLKKIPEIYSPSDRHIKYIKADDSLVLIGYSDALSVKHLPVSDVRGLYQKERAHLQALIVDPEKAEEKEANQKRLESLDISESKFSGYITAKGWPENMDIKLRIRSGGSYKATVYSKEAYKRVQTAVGDLLIIEMPEYMLRNAKVQMVPRRRHRADSVSQTHLISFVGLTEVCEGNGNLYEEKNE